MNWFPKINSEAFEQWLIASGSGSFVQQGRKLDPFVTSMRKLHLAHSRLSNLNAGQPIGISDVNQGKADLKGAGLLNAIGSDLSNLGKKALDAWTAFGIPTGDDAYEIHRALILLFKAKEERNSQYLDYISFWLELRSLFSYNLLINSAELLYFFSYFNKKLNGFNPYKVIEGLGLDDTDFNVPIDWDKIKRFFPAAATTQAIEKYRTTIGGYVSRQGRINFCIALEIITHVESSETIISALSIDQPKKDLLKNIVLELSKTNNMGLNKIFFGAPGTGKSKAVKDLTSGHSKIQVTFHPDTDYASFVGSYKPVTDTDGKTIIYKFVPQAFIKAYLKAWVEPDKQHYLVIEEINRGNCAQIFGDIFQSLDRGADGNSEYSVDIDTDLANYLKAEFSITGRETSKGRYETILKDNYDHEGYEKIVLPSNLIIAATMNTSDQSLFPMDSAFKRRWDWQYIPINYTDADNLTIKIDEHSECKWGQFISIVNPKIKHLSGSEDKQLGNRFVNPSDGIITFEQVRSKVLFYLWVEIYKDEQGNTDNIFRYKEEDNILDFQYGDLYSGIKDKLTEVELVKAFFEYNQIPITAV